MKFRNLFAGILAAAAFFAVSACDEPENTGEPKIAIAGVENGVLEFAQEGETKTIKIVATRDWKVAEELPEWINMQTEGEITKGTDVDIVVSPNDGMDREQVLTFRAGIAKKAITIKQNGAGGSEEDAIVYYNNFDKEEATKTYGSGSSYPYLDQFEGWKNESGTGIANVEYAFKGMSARSNSTSNSNYSDYAGSGMNNMFFGSDAYFEVKNVTLGSATNYTLSFGAEKYNQTLGSDFSASEFKVYVSDQADPGAERWVELSYTFAKGAMPSGRWDLASSQITIPAGTTTLSIYVSTSVASSYRLDDLKLMEAAEAGTAVDFTKGVKVGESAGGGDEPGEIESITIADFIAKADKNTTYRLTGKITSEPNATYGDCDINDGTGTVKIYKISNYQDYLGKMKIGGTVTVTGKYDLYKNTIHECTPCTIEKYEDPVEVGPTEMTIAQVKAASAGDAVLVKNVQVMAQYKNGVVVSDGKDNIIAYKKDMSPLPAVGSKLTVNGIVSEYGGLKQIANPEFADIVAGTATLPASKDITSAFATYGGSDVELISYRGVLSISGTYYNVKVGDLTDRQGSIQYPVQDLADYNGKDVIVTGYFSGISGSSTKYVGVMLTDIKLADPEAKLFSVSPLALNVTADATEASFHVSGNVAWTASCDNSAFTLSTTSGTGDAEVKVTFAANTSEEAKVANIKVSTTENASTKEYTVVLTQAKQTSGGSTKTDILDVSLFGSITGTAYADFSGVQGSESPAVYGGQIATNKGTCIQLRSSGSNAGIVSTTSGGKIRKIIVTWNSSTSTTGNRQLDIYGSSAAYADAKALYDAANQGTLLGSIVCGTQTEITVTGDYEYVGMRSKNGAMYIDKIEIVWE